MMTSTTRSLFALLGIGVVACGGDEAPSPQTEGASSAFAQPVAPEASAVHDARYQARDDVPPHAADDVAVEVAADASERDDEAAPVGDDATSYALPPVDSVDKNGPFAVTTDQSGGASSWIFRPTELGKDGVKHPVFVFGNGATMTPSAYANAMRLVASHGFIVVQPTNPFVTPGDLKAALDWILAEGERAGSIFHQKLSGKAAMGGHSLGSLGTFDVEANETRLSTTIHVAGGSFDAKGSSKVRTPTAYICGAPGANGNVLNPTADLAQPQCETDFANATQPTFYTSMRGVGHIPAVGSAAPAIVAWLRWHLAGESERKAMFTGPDGLFFKGIFNSQTKNW